MRLAFAFLFVVSWRCGVVRGGFDSGSSSWCARPPRAPRRAPAPPCDLSKNTYCNTPGTAYPWHAIRRFVRENQGLMRRMYGEERHISVLKAELENFIEYDEEVRKPGEFDEDLIKTKLMYTKKSHGRAIKDKPHFRPIQSAEKNKKVDNDALKVKPLNTSEVKVNSTKKSNKTEISNETTYDDNGISYKTQLESIANIEINNLDPDVITLDAVIKQSIETNSIYPNPSSNLKSEDSDSDANNATTTVNTTTENYANYTEPDLVSETTVVDQYEDRETTTESTESSKDDWRPMVLDTSTLPPTLLFTEHEKTKNVDRMDTKVNEKREELHVKPTTANHQDAVRPAVISLKGANACETSEEIAAPFWANSTRGEVLALLNMYPFEQYIHLEKCVHERKQMYCREGCRCEQQYRLHRLLAYDPRNECRGIFADWFKFPACCNCKCYDVPLEFRARSPRILHPQYDEEVKRVIYEDVARDWYSMTAYDEEELEEDLF